MKSAVLALALATLPTVAFAQQQSKLEPITLTGEQVNAMLKQLGTLPAASSYDLITVLLNAEHAAQEAAAKAKPEKPAAKPKHP